MIILISFVEYHAVLYISGHGVCMNILTRNQFQDISLVLTPWLYGLSSNKPKNPMVYSTEGLQEPAHAAVDSQC